MSPAFPSRRAAQFDALLDGTRTAAPSAELAELLAVAEGLRAVPEVAPRAEFAASLRERLMAEAPEALATPASVDTARLTVGRRTPSKTSRERRIGVAIAAFSLVGASAATAVASQGSLPGDTLYPVKRLIEDARTSLTMGDDAKADILLSHARTRLDEARELGGRDDVDTGRVEDALHDFGDSADQASAALLAEYADHGDAQNINDLRTFTQESVTTVSELADLLPPSLDEALADVTNTLLTIDHSAAQACPACDAAGIFELPPTLVDLLGATTGAIAPTSASTTLPSTAGEVAGTSPKPAPSSGSTTAPDTSTQQLTDPLTDATGGGKGGKGGTPSGGATSLGGAVSGAGGAVGDTVGGVGGGVSDLGDQVGGPVGGVVGGVGGTVEDLGGAVGGVTGGVGGLLGGPSPTPSP
jgi:hypothetical protein